MDFSFSADLSSFPPFLSVFPLLPFTLEIVSPVTSPNATDYRHGN